MSGKWYIENGPQGDVVLSSRIRLARNLKNTPFPDRLSESRAAEICQTIALPLLRLKSPKMTVIRMSDLSPYRAISLAEKHIISPEFTDNIPGHALAVSEDENISIMLCGEDHIRLQSMQAGFSLDEAYAAASRLDDYLEQSLQFAFDERLGYLTQCPIDLGTGMRASVFLHLPALAQNWEISRLSATVEKLGLSLRGSYDEGNVAKGDIYRLSNRITLGISEKNAIENLKSITLQIATQERNAREELEKNDATIDKIYRSYGILSSAHMLGHEEMMELLSSVRLGANKGIIPVRPETVNALNALLQPATMNADYGEQMNANQREILRAEIIRKKLDEDAKALATQS